MYIHLERSVSNISVFVRSSQLVMENDVRQTVTYRTSWCSQVCWL